MKRMAMSALHGLICVASALAQEPTVDQILEKYIQATGGRAAAEKLTSRASKGTFEMPAMGLKGATEIFAKAPNKVLITTNIPGLGVVEQGFNGTVGWSRDAMQGLREQSGAELAAIRRDAQFHKHIRLKDLYPKMELKPSEKVGQRQTHVIEATPAEGVPEKWYFDAETGFLLRVDTVRESPQGKIALEVSMEDYREIDGVKIPFTVRQSNPAFNLTIRIDEVKHNVSIDEAKFEKPAAQP